MSKTPAGTLYRGREGMWSWVGHRVTGVAIFFFLLVHVLDTALVRVSPEAYNVVIATYKNPFMAILEDDGRYEPCFQKGHERVLIRGYNDVVCLRRYTYQRGVQYVY
ncbi:MAG TPA: hypothetical protein VHH13_11560 [Arthrobacter sp.]|nr:hypothetical protein [Arthrobacter sp.]